MASAPAKVLPQSGLIHMENKELSECRMKNICASYGKRPTGRCMGTVDSGRGELL
jgi:hypothetical protein